MKRLELKWLELVFENTESVRIDVNDIEDFTVFNVYEEHELCNYGDRTVLVETRWCDGIFLRINKRANAYREDLQNGMKIFDRITEYNDIVYIEYHDEKGECIDVVKMPWDDTLEENNKQQSYIDQVWDGSLVIMIDKKFNGGS